MKNLHLTTKVFLILAPLLVVTFGVVIYTTFRFQEQQVLQLSQNAAQSQAAIIRNSLVHMMQTQEEVDDAYLRQISTPGELENVQVLFRYDSLRLKKEYVSAFRTKKLHDREARVAEKVSMYAGDVFTDMKPLWIMSCDITQHERPEDGAQDYRLPSLESGIPTHFWSCGRLRIVQPFFAERKCLQCHEVTLGTVLGAASMEVPIGKTVGAIRENAIRSVLIFFVLVTAVSLLGAFIFRRFVSRPVGKLIHATKAIGRGEAVRGMSEQFDNDEFGQLARSFEEMQTKLEKTQDELIKRERMSTLGQMASGIIHDFRNPMTNITVGVQLLQSQKALADHKRAEIFQTVLESVDRMARMTQELLEFARGETTLSYTEVRLDEFARNLDTHVRQHLEGNGIQFSIDIAGTHSCSMDGDRIERCLINLINNAQDALRQGGAIRVGIRRENGNVCFRVEDNGPGIPEKIRDKVFEPFVTMGKQQGTGLGLAITKRVIEQHGGRIGFETEENKGTTFEIKIPAG